MFEAISELSVRKQVVVVRVSDNSFYDIPRLQTRRIFYNDCSINFRSVVLGPANRYVIWLDLVNDHSLRRSNLFF